MGQLFYQIGIELYFALIKILSLFGHKKAIDFIKGRKNTFRDLKHFCQNNPSAHRVWFHVSSLGEYEQAKPVIEGIKKENKSSQIFLSFFSPSGMNHAQTDGFVDYKFYIPKDNSAHAIKLLDIMKPAFIVFVKYDVWHHYIHQAQSRSIKTILISALFRKDHIYFKFYGGFFKRILKNLSHIFVQNTSSLELLNAAGIHSVTVCGDTRVDSVYQRSLNPREIDFIEKFRNPEKRLFIIGSAWEDDWKKVLSIYDRIHSQYQLIIAPHKITPDVIQAISQEYKDYKKCLQSEGNANNQYDILIIDSIGWLKNIYQYTAAAWIGGGYKSSGIHNTLEPAVYGNALFFGPNYKKFPEAIEMIALGGAKSVDKIEDIIQIIEDPKLINKMGAINKQYITKSIGATDEIVQEIIKNIN